jgi:hypothetical protein
MSSPRAAVLGALLAAPLAALALASSLAACGAPAARRPSVNQPPLPVLEAPDEARVGERVFVSGDASSDLEGIVSEVFLLFGDGSPPLADFSAEHVYAAPGAYLLELYVMDNDGASARARRRILIRD